MRYQVTVTTEVEADNPEQAAELLWEGTTEMSVEEILPPPVFIDPADLKRVIDAYDTVIRGNDAEDWNTIRAVYMDTSGEVLYEVLDTAWDVGVLNEQNKDDQVLRDAIQDAFDVYKQTVLENDPRNIPSTNGEE